MSIRLSTRRDIYLNRYTSTKTARGFVNGFSTAFDGIDEYCEDSDPGILNNLSVFLWIKAPSTTGNQIPISQWDGNAKRSWEILTTDDGMRIALSSDGLGAQKNYSADLAGDVVRDGTWHHAGFTFATNVLKLYRDGVELNPSVLNDLTCNALFDTNTPLKVGANESGGPANFFEGSIDEVSMSDNTVLTDAEVSELYNNGIVSDLTRHSRFSDLAHWYRMGDGSTFPTINDEAGSNDLTMINMTASNSETDVP